MASWTRWLAAAGMLGASASFGGVAWAEPSMAWVAAASGGPVEQRVAVAVGPSRSVVWLSLRADGAGPLGVVVAIPPGASLDQSSDAWFEALDLATAPRVLVPADGITSCDPASPGPGYVVEAADAIASTMPIDQALVASPAEVSAWMSDRGVSVDATLEQALEASAGARYFLSLFPASSADRLTPTWRLTLPGAIGALPLSLVRAGASDLTVTAWSLGEGRATLAGLEERSGAPAGLIFDPADPSTNYGSLRHDALVGAAAAWLESASHEALAANVSILDGRATIDGVVTGYFERALAAGDLGEDIITCTQSAASALASSSPTAIACPANTLGPDDAAACEELVVSGQLDPARLRCGAVDDLALALSGLRPSQVWLTRHTLVIAAAATAPAPSLSFEAGASVSPVIAAGEVDEAACGPIGTGTGTGGTSGAGGAGGTSGAGGAGGASGQGGASGSSSDSTVVVGGGPGPIPGRPTDPSGGYPSDGYDDYGDVVVSGCACSGTDTGYDSYDDGSSDDCSSDTSDSYYDDSSDDCASDTSDAYGDSSDDCASDSSSSDDCASDTSSSSDCSVRGGKRRRLPPLSAMTLLGMVALVPLRRRLRPRR